MSNKLTTTQHQELNRRAYHLASNMVLFDNTVYMQNIDEDDDVVHPILQEYVTDIREHYAPVDIQEVIDDYADAIKSFFLNNLTWLQEQNGGAN
jgi:hypothetical protein